MWTDTGWDWVILGVGYVLALSLFRFLGGFAAAGSAITRWGRSTSEKRAPGIAARLRAASAKDGADGGAEERVVEPLRDLR